MGRPPPQILGDRPPQSPLGLRPWMYVAHAINVPILASYALHTIHVCVYINASGLLQSAL